jgi:hypothetical protein
MSGRSAASCFASFPPPNWGITTSVIIKVDTALVFSRHLQRLVPVADCRRVSLDLFLLNEHSGRNLRIISGACHTHAAPKNDEF